MNTNVKIQFQEKESIKLDRFDGTNYTRWQDRMSWLLLSLNLYYLLDPKLQPVPDSNENDTAEQKAKTEADKAKRETDEMLCRGHILNSLTNRPYDIYRNYKTPQDIWNALESKYKHMKEGTDRFLALKYFEFSFVDGMPIMDQVRDLEILVSQMSELEINVPDAIQVGAILAKLPPTWHDYKRKILHSSEKFSIERFTTNLQIECENRARDESLMGSKVNQVTSNGPVLGASSSGKSQNNLKVQKKDFKKSNFKKERACFHCGKKGHYIKE